MKRIKKLFLSLWMYVPFGRIVRFQYEGLRITLLKNLYIVIDSGKNTTKDMLPITMVSQKLVDEIERQMIKRGY